MRRRGVVGRVGEALGGADHVHRMAGSMAGPGLSQPRRLLTRRQQPP